MRSTLSSYLNSPAVSRYRSRIAVTAAAAAATTGIGVAAATTGTVPWAAAASNVAGSSHAAANQASANAGYRAFGSVADARSAHGGSAKPVAAKAVAAKAVAAKPVAAKAVAAKAVAANVGPAKSGSAGVQATGLHFDAKDTSTRPATAASAPARSSAHMPGFLATPVTTVRHASTAHAAATDAGHATTAVSGNVTSGHAVPSGKASAPSGKGSAPSGKASAPSGKASAPSGKGSTPSRHAASKPVTHVKPAPYRIYDSVTPSAIPAHQNVATYANGAYRVAASTIHGHGHVLWIDTNGSDPSASALDVEPGDATPSLAAQWVKDKLTADPNTNAIVYTMISEWQSVKDAISTLPSAMQSKVRYWIADPTGVPHVVPGSSATQWYWGRSYDISTALPGFW